MATGLTFGDLFKQALVLDADVCGAVDAYMADAQTGVFPIGEGYGLDLSAAFDAHGTARKVLADPGTSDTFKRTMARTPILLAPPKKR